jgi:hypothetical protein
MPPDNLLSDDLGWFTPVDLDLLFRALSNVKDSASVVLVGGQALSFWVDFYDIPVPITDTPYLTQDADFLALKEDARAINDILCGTLKIATMDDNTPNTATIVFMGPSGKKLMVDFLGTVVGLSPEEVRRLSVEIDINGNNLNVMHPLLCLRSRICNLYTLASKRDRNGLAQAKVAIEVANRYFQKRVLEGDIRDALNGTKLIADLADSKAGKFVWDKWEIDVMQAVDPRVFPVPDFRETEWPKQLRKISDARQRLKTMHENRQAAKRTIPKRR